MTRLEFKPVDRVVDARSGDSILETAIKFDVPLEHACGGFCACTTCHVHVESGGDSLSEMDTDEKDRLEGVQDFVAGKSRLGCQAKIQGAGPVTVTIMNVAN